MFKYHEINSEGCNIRCKLYYNEKKTAGKAVIFGTGFAGHKDNNAANVFAQKLLSKQKDVIVIVFNWPAHGDDVKKKLVLDDCAKYLNLVIREAKTVFGASELYAYATSFGGYLFLKYISENGNPFEKTALRCPAVNMYEVLTGTIMKNDEYDRVMKGKDVQVGFDKKVIVTPSLLEELKENDIRSRDYTQYAQSILIMHGDSDEVVPFEEGMAFAQNNRIEFIPFKGADHRFRNPDHLSLANKYAMEFFGLR